MSLSPSINNAAESGDFTSDQQLLDRLDSQKLTRFHWKATVVAGMGFLTDSYDLFVIGTVLLLIGKDSSIGKSSLFGANFAANSALVGSTALISAFLGALVFGTIADRVGRRFIYGVELLVLAVGALASAFSPDLTWLIIFRFILGIGIGGDYPVSATIISEHANMRDRGKLIGTVFAMQAAGIVLGYLCALIVLGFGASPDLSWRILLGLGAIPALATFWIRRKMPESPRFLLHVKGDRAAVEAAMNQTGALPRSRSHAQRRGPMRFARIARVGRAEAGAGRVRTVKRGKQQLSWRLLLSSPRFMLMLLGTAGCWFLMDYAYYGTTISSPIVIQHILGNGASSFMTTLAGFVIVVVAAVPGYIVAVLTLDRLGRRKIQFFGFAMMTLCYAAIALVPAVRDTIWAFALAFGLSYFFVEFGPNTTTFLYPAEIFPTAARTTAHGISAGLAKVGAFVGVLVFPLLEAQQGGKDIALAIGAAAITAALGFGLTFLLPEPNQQSLEDAERAVAWRVVRAGDDTASPNPPAPPVTLNRRPRI